MKSNKHLKPQIKDHFSGVAKDFSEPMQILGINKNSCFGK
jgi:hypothetical protein